MGPRRWGEEMDLVSVLVSDFVLGSLCVVRFDPGGCGVPDAKVALFGRANA